VPSSIVSDTRDTIIHATEQSHLWYPHVHCGAPAVMIVSEKVAKRLAESAHLIQFRSPQIPPSGRHSRNASFNIEKRSLYKSWGFHWAILFYFWYYHRLVWNPLCLEARALLISTDDICHGCRSSVDSRGDETPATNMGDFVCVHSICGDVGPKYICWKFVPC